MALHRMNKERDSETSSIEGSIKQVKGNEEPLIAEIITAVFVNRAGIKTANSFRKRTACIQNRRGCAV